MPRRGKEVDDAPWGADHRDTLFVLWTPIGPPGMTTRDDACGAVLGSKFIECFQDNESVESSRRRGSLEWHTKYYRSAQRHTRTREVTEGVIYMLRDLVSYQQTVPSLVSQAYRDASPGWPRRG